jgi:DNA-binding beta-propeller fold protein YncE
MRTAKTNRDGMGRCRCRTHGAECSSTRNCCGSLTCRYRRCTPSAWQCVRNTDCSGSSDTCINGTCFCGGNAPCDGSAPICSAGTCLACLTDPDCPAATPVCCSGACLAPWTPQTFFGSGPGSGADDFNLPTSVGLSTDDLTVLVADFLNHRVSMWTRPTATSADWTHRINFGQNGTSNDRFNNPEGVALTTDGLTALIADATNNRVSVWTRSGAAATDWQPQTTFGSAGAGNGQFTSPKSLAVSADGLTVWVADGDNNRVAVWARTSPTGTNWQQQATFGSVGNGAGQFFLPLDVDISADTLTAVVADAGNHRVSVWTRQTAASTTWTFQSTFGSGPGSGPTQFNQPSGLALSPNALTAWIADTYNNRISVWTRPSSTSTAWTPWITFGSAGTGLANMTHPWGVAISSGASTILIADWNNRVDAWVTSACG